MGVDSYEKYCTERGLIAPRGLSNLLQSDVAHCLDGLLYRLDVPDKAPNSLAWAFELLSDSAIPPPANLLPLLPVDDASIACAVCQEISDDIEHTATPAEVVRWHYDRIVPRFQGAILDSDAECYVRSMAEELAMRPWGLERIKKIAEGYRKEYTSRNKRPRSFVNRPVQIACQNVIIGLAALQQDSTFDGLRVEVYLTCEVPHLATHEGNRALAALILCDAFQNGGTMEIRFGSKRSPQEVPPGLRRFARSRGFEIGADDRFAITPAEARRLFLAVTPMPQELGLRVFDFIDRGLISPERLCFILLAPVWSCIELDYLLATSSRVTSILEGGADPVQRRPRLAELEATRAALMVGMLHRRLDNQDNAGRLDGEARVFEDNRKGITWSIDEKNGVVTFISVLEGKVAWSPLSQPLELSPHGQLLVVPRALPICGDFELVRELQGEFPEATIALLIPADVHDSVPIGLPYLLYPDRIIDLDTEIERRLLSSRVGRS